MIAVPSYAGGDVINPADRWLAHSTAADGFIRPYD